MKNEGFTLVELLAVILILAFIAIIAVPIVLNIITEAKIKSLKISTSEYIRAVNTSLINEEVFNNVKDGLYTITDNGKKIVLGDKEIYIASEGHGLKSGLLLIEDSKVKRVLKGMIDDYYARVTDEDIEILKNLNESTLVNGQTFNASIKNLVGDTKDDGSVPNGNTVDTKVKKIIFLQDSVLPEGLTKEELIKLQFTDLSEKNNNSIKGYYDEKTGTIYVYSEGYITCPNALSHLFYNFQGAEEIELNLIDTSKVKDMSGMFFSCKSLKNVNLLGLDTSQVTSNGFGWRDDAIFANCSSLEYLDLSGFDTSRITGMWNTFLGCKNLKEIKFGKNFNTSKVITMRSMFEGCSSLTELDLSSFNTSQVTTFEGMFYNCTNLKKIKGLKNFDTTGASYMHSMFFNCNSLIELDLTGFDISGVTLIKEMFKNCTNLKEIKFGEHFNTKKVTDMSGMFYSCRSLVNLDLSMFDTSQVKNMGTMFQGCSSLTELDITNFDTSQVTYMAWMFNGCSKLKVVKVSNKWVTEGVTTYQMFLGCPAGEVTVV